MLHRCSVASSVWDGVFEWCKAPKDLFLSVKEVLRIESDWPISKTQKKTLRIHQGTTPLGSVLGLEKGLWLSLGVQVLFRLHQGADLDRFVLGSGNGLWLCSGSMLSKDAHLHAFSHGLFYVEFYSTGLLDLVGAGGLCS
ncbi:hypothetical protein E3N88_09063 [Mikania micrantha]|uniref:Uncharacterized protein n=1 Tax=Mikania micrantha TaxID=192012 RepID=A0A5N6PIY2_9ASTR|nr:hypothetical protein E3N88_09063 [Mikania micrantha]